MFDYVNKCRCCGYDNLVKYLDLGNQPLANAYHKGEKLEVFPLEVMYCAKCYHSQLSIVVKPGLMFTHYLYVSGTTATFRNHCGDLAKQAYKLCGKQSPKVLDIACNDGTLLRCFKKLGCETYGVDPAENLTELTKDLNVKVDYWNENIELNEKFDIITGTNVFAHVDNIYGFLKAAASHLNNDGTIILEFPYCKEMLLNSEFDTIYHEHLSYFLIYPFTQLLNRFDNLYISDILTTEIHGGSIRIFLKKNCTDHCQLTHRYIENEKILLNPETYIDFANKAAQQKEDLLSLIQKLDKPVIGYGASAKGNTMLNYFKLNMLKYIVDDNPMKWGYYTPGQNIEIKSPQHLADEVDGVNVLLLAWNFEKEIISKVNAIRNKRTNFVKYIPKVHYVEQPN